MNGWQKGRREEGREGGRGGREGGVDLPPLGIRFRVAGPRFLNTPRTRVSSLFPSIGEGGKEGGREGGTEGGEGGASSKRPREMLKEDWVIASRVRDLMLS